MRFQYRFNGHHENDRLNLFIDNELFWSVSADIYNDGIMTDSGWIGIGEFIGKTVRICFMLENGTEAQACSIIDNLEFAYEVVPEDETPETEEPDTNTDISESGDENAVSGGGDGGGCFIATVINTANNGHVMPVLFGFWLWPLLLALPSLDGPRSTRKARKRCYNFTADEEDGKNRFYLSRENRDK